MKNKVIAIALALTTVTWAVPFVGSAATVEELQAQINALLQQIAQLQAQLAGQGGTTPATTACFTKYLYKGMSDPEVTTLQQVLKQDASIYPEGLVTGYFGSLTEAAVKKFQAKYGIDQTGTVGPITRAKLNSLYCVTPTTTPTTTATVTPTPTPIVNAYGTLSINKVPVNNPAYTYYAGGTYELFAGEFKATGSDITVRKIGIDITNNQNLFPWQVLSTISLWDGSTKLAELAVNQANLIEDSFAAKYILNVGGLNWVIPNGQKKTLTVKATLLPALSSSVMDKLDNPGAEFKIIMNENIVYADTAGVVYTDGLGIIAKNLSVNIATSTAESDAASFVVSTATDNPKEGNVIVSKTNTTPVTLLKFTVKNDSDVSATINRASTMIEVNATPTATLITAVELYDGSTRIQTKAPSFGTAVTSSIEWDNFTLPIAANTTKTLTIKAVIASVDEDALTGSETVKATNFGMQGVDTNSNVVGEASYTVAGKAQHIFLKAPTFALGNVSFTASGTDTSPRKTGEAKIGLYITAQGGSDIYVSDNPASTTLKIAQGSTSAELSNAFTCTSNAFVETGVGYRIPAGTTATCELNGIVTVTTSQGGYYQLQVEKVTWGTSTTPNVGQTWGWDDFKTGLLYLEP